MHFWALVFTYKYHSQLQPFIIAQHACLYLFVLYMTRRLGFGVLLPKVLTCTYANTNLHRRTTVTNYCGKLSVPLNSTQPNFMLSFHLQLGGTSTFLFLLRLHDGKSSEFKAENFRKLQFFISIS